MNQRKPRAFTLVELLVVMVIISILLGFILNASMASVQRAQERATQALITKLEGGLNDRLDALLQTRPDPTAGHLAMAAVYNGNATLPGYLRAQAIAWYDYLKAEMPDTFFVQNASPSASAGVWPINFAGTPFPYASSSNYTYYYLPMNNYAGNPQLARASTGIYGASYPAAAGIYKNLGYLPPGYDGIDNNADGYIDDALEGIGNDPQVPSPDNPNAQISLSSLIQQRLANHTHVTARSEMLYALLVEGRGPLGSVFNADEFTDKEVQDTDKDGLPEFVDAWGNPLQFFRWPILYHSDIQRGQVVQAGGETSWNLAPPYQTMYEQREQDPLDLNQQLVAPMWWSGGSNANANAGNVFSGYPNPVVNGASAAVQAFEFYFHRLSEPLYPPPSSSSYTAANYWDRGSAYGSRRAYYSKFLVVSGGLDGQLGVFLYSDAALSTLGTKAAWALIANENNALPFSPTDPTALIVDFTQYASYQSQTIQYSASDPLDPTNPSSYTLMQAAQDDISNQNIQTTIGIGGGG